MKSLLATILTIFSVSAFAGVNLNLSLKSDYADGLGYAQVTQLENGRLQVIIDRNHCNQHGCTVMAPEHFVTDPEVIDDSRPVDGPLYLRLNENINLSISSGFSISGEIQATLIETVNGQVKVYELKPHLGYAEIVNSANKR